MKSRIRFFNVQRSALVALALCAFASSALPARQAHFHGVVKGMVVSRPDVQSDLGVTVGQKKRMAGLYDQLMDAFPTGDQAKIQKMEAEILLVLTAPQRKRLDEITFQMSGGNYVSESVPLQHKLGMSKAELDKLQRLIADSETPIITGAQLESVLAPGQKARCEQMLGRPFVAAKGPMVMTHSLKRVAIRRPLKQLESGTMAPDFVALTANGKEVKLSELRGKIVVLDFWATWCGPCMASLPSINGLQVRTRDQNVYVLALNVWDSKSAFKKWTTANDQLSLHFAIDPAGENRGHDIPALYHVDGIPTTYVIDPSGRIVDSHVGSDETAARVTNSLKIAANGKPNAKLLEALKSLGVHL